MFFLIIYLIFKNFCGRANECSKYIDIYIYIYFNSRDFKSKLRIQKDVFFVRRLDCMMKM